MNDYPLSENEQERMGFDDSANLMAAQLRAQQLEQEYEELDDQECVQFLRSQLPEHLERHFNTEQTEAIMEAAQTEDPQKERKSLLFIAGASALLDEHFEDNEQTE